ncbi:uncharacterized protein LOC105440590 [Strongylocentrotus purpuratus]|uniref:Uncharacterized protein n=1 Tax=Strongylocentrotus purpuratus TaxID=7668 RepID=A0A7M7P1E4_STRPU|nr:uncharacterized protein LOC105440590 [Strongylocentrotus purpuratus]
MEIRMDYIWIILLLHPTDALPLEWDMPIGPPQPPPKGESDHESGRSGLIALGVLYFLIIVAVSCGVIAACCFRRRVVQAELQSRLSRASSTQRSSISRLNAAILDEQASNSARRSTITPSETPTSNSIEGSRQGGGDGVTMVTKNGLLAVPNNI